MLIIKRKVNFILDKKKLSYTKLGKLVGYDRAFISGTLSNRRPFPDELKERLLPILKVSEEEFENWILASKYPRHVFEMAVKAKKEHGNNPKLIVTDNIDKILETKNLSRTKAAKQIKASQNAFNNAVMIGILSKNMKEKVDPFLGISIEELQAWEIADKYSLKELEKALDLHND